MLRTVLLMPNYGLRRQVMKNKILVVVFGVICGLACWSCGSEADVGLETAGADEAAIGGIGSYCEVQNGQYTGRCLNQTLCSLTRVKTCTGTPGGSYRTNCGGPLHYLYVDLTKPC